MQIKSSDGALSMRPTSVRPAAVSTLTPGPQSGPVSLSISSEVRALSALLGQPLPELGSLHVLDLLTPPDRLMLARAVEFASREGIALEEVRKLVIDLSLHRLEGLPVRAPQRGPAPPLASAWPAPPSELDADLEHTPTLTMAAKQPVAAPELAQPSRVDTPAPGAPSLLRPLARFSPRDEQLARAILSSLALHDSQLDPQFVRALLDPDRRPTHAVDFAFLRRLVIALSASHVDGACDPRVSGERRDARDALAQAVVGMIEALGELPALAELDLAEGAAQLRLRWPALVETPRPHATLEPAAASEPLVPTLPHLPSNERDPVRVPFAHAPGPLQLPRADRALLGVLYAAAKSEPELARVDHFALALRALRAAERREQAAAPVAHSLRPSAPPLRREPSRSAEHAPPAAARVPAPARSPLGSARAEELPPFNAARVDHAAHETAELAVDPERSESAAGSVPPGPAEPRQPIEGRQPSEPRSFPAARPVEPRWLPQPAAPLSPEAAPLPSPDPRAAPAPAAWTAAETRDSSAGAVAHTRAEDPGHGIGSASQWAAKVAGSYARVASEGASLPALATREWSAQGAGTHGTAHGAASSAALSSFEGPRDLAPMASLTRPLNTAEALGLAGLMRELKTRALRTARVRKRHLNAGNVRPLESLREAAYDAEADDPVLDAAPRRRRVRWHLLLERRKRRRNKPR